MKHCFNLDTLSLTGALSALDEGQTTSVDLVRAMLDRAERKESVYHTWAALDPTIVIKQAEEDDRLRLVGHAGPVSGIPVGIKDVIATNDYPTRAGSHVLDNESVTGDAEIVAKMRNAGAVIMGKLVTHEFALGQNTPLTRNAWASTHYPGGSSAGAGVAVALGSTLAAVGTDSAGSVRKPASLNGVVGFKPSYGRLPTDGVIPVSETLDHVGLITRTVGDCHSVFGVVADQTTRASPTGRCVCRLGTPYGYFETQLDAEVSDVVTDAAARLARDRYVELVPLELSLPETAVAAGFVLMAGEGALVHQRWLKSSWHQYDAATRDFLLAGTMLPAAMLASAYAARRELTSCMVKVLDECALDGLLVPTLPLAAKDYADMDNDRDLSRYIRYTVVANITGQPAISIPAGFTARGFPVGISVLGKHGEDEKTLAVAASVEAALGLRFCSPE